MSKLVKGQSVVMFSSGNMLSSGITTVKSIGKKYISTACGLRRPVNGSDVFVPVEQAAEFYLVNVHGMSSDLAKQTLTADKAAAVANMQAHFTAVGNYRGGNVQICTAIVDKANSLKV